MNNLCSCAMVNLTKGVRLYIDQLKSRSKNSSSTKEYYHKHRYYVNFYKRYLKEEKRLILTTKTDSKKITADQKLAKQLGRTLVAIHVKRSNLKHK